MTNYTNMEKVNGTVTLTIEQYEKLINKIQTLEKAYNDGDAVHLELKSGIYTVVEYDDVSQLVFKAYQDLQSKVISRDFERQAELFKLETKIRELVMDKRVLTRRGELYQQFFESNPSVKKLWDASPYCKLYQP